MAADPIQRIYEKRKLANVKALSSYKAPNDNFRASEVLDCVRRMYYRRAGYIPAADDPRMEDYGVDGNVCHDSTRAFLVRHGVKVMGVRFEKNGTQVETMSKTHTFTFSGIKFKVSARLDGAIRIGGVKHILEIKSKGFWKLKPFLEAYSAGGNELNVRESLQVNAPEHIAQANMCMDMFDIPYTYLLFKDRSECAVGLHERNKPDRILGGVVLELDSKRQESTLRRLAGVQHALDRELAPEPEYLDGSKACGFCPFYHLCHGAQRRLAQSKQPPTWHPQLGEVVHVSDL